MTVDRRKRIFVAGHRGLVGSAIVRALAQRGETEVIVRTHQELDLGDEMATRAFFDKERPDHVYLAAAKVGGIHANDSMPADFILDNLRIQTSVIEAARRSEVQKLLFLGSSCIYPRLAPQPISEDALMSGPLEPTNAAYAIAKIAGIQMVQSYRRQHGVGWISLMPTNLYGPNDNFHPERGHVVPSLVRRFHEAKLAKLSEVVAWGTGTPRRELLYVDDLADAALFAMEHYDSERILNVGSGAEVSIAELAAQIQAVVGYPGKVVFDASKPDGTPRKLLDVSRLSALGWRARTALEQGLAQTYAWYVRSAGSTTSV